MVVRNGLNPEKEERYHFTAYTSTEAECGKKTFELTIHSLSTVSVHYSKALCRSNSLMLNALYMHNHGNLSAKKAWNS